jgi:integrase
LRRHEAVGLRIDDLQQREEHWAIVDLLGKAGHVRTVPIPDWVKGQLDEWLEAAGIARGGPQIHVGSADAIKKDFSRANANSNDSIFRLLFR